MCYEQRSFRSWLRSKAHKPEQIKPEIERSRPDLQPIDRTPEREASHRKELEREPEEIV